MDEHIYKSHNKSLLLYHLVFPAKYRRKIFSDDVEITLKNICVGISHCYEVNFIEIGVDEDHVHFLIQSVPMLSVTQLVKMLKSITARKLFLAHPEIKEQLWGGSLWTSGFYVNTVGQYASKDVIKRYVAEQWKYKKIIKACLISIWARLLNTSYACIEVVYSRIAGCLHDTLKIIFRKFKFHTSRAKDPVYKIKTFT